MASLVDYHGLQVVSPDPTGDGGLAIQNDLKSLVDWNPQSVWSQSASPTTSDDNTEEYYPGSLWLRTDTMPPQLFLCKSSATGAAVWVPVLLNVVQDSAPQLGGDLDANGHEITDASGVTISAGGNLTLNDGANVVSGSTTGTRIGTSASQKLGFWNAAPVAQFASTGTTAGATGGTGIPVLSGSTFTGNTGSTAYTIGDIVAALKKCGIIAG